MSAITNPVPSPVEPPPAPQAKPEEARGSRKWLILLVVVLVAGAVAWMTLRKPQQAAKPVIVFRTAKIVRGTVIRTVRISGQTSARDYANIIAPRLRGPEARASLFLLQLAKGGTMVKKGDMLAQLDAQAARDHVDDTAASVAQSKLDVQKRVGEQEVEWENLQQTLRVSKATLDKAKLDYGGSETRTVIDRELMKLSVEESAAAYQQQAEDLKNKQVSQKAERRVMEINLLKTERHLNRDLVDIKKYDIKAPMPGLVVLMSIQRGPGDQAQIQAGDQVYPGMPLIKVVDPKSMQVEANINQSECSSFRVGQECHISLDAFPGLTFKGKIFSIGALAAGGWRQNYYIRNIPVRVTIEGADPRLIPDLSAAVDVALERADNALSVPLAAVSIEGKKQVVYVKAGEGFVRREVELGLRSSTRAVVLAGLNEGEEVRLN